MRMFGISVHVIAPGFFMSNLHTNCRINDSIDKAWNETSEDMRVVYGQEYKERCKDKRIKSIKDTV